MFIDAVEMACNHQVKAGQLKRRQKVRILASLALRGIKQEVESRVTAELKLDATVKTKEGLIDWENFDPEKFKILVEMIIAILKAFNIGI